MSPRRSVRLLPALLLVFLVAACSGGAGQAQRVVVRIKQTPNQILYEPPSVTVRPGTTVVWQNDSDWPATVTCNPDGFADAALVSLPDGAQAWSSGVIYPGQTWSYQFTRAGVYLYASRLAESPATVGTVEVK